MALVSCPLCSASLPAESLQLHLRHHLNFLPYKCALCGVAFHSLYDGRRHFARAEKGHAGAAVQLVESADEAVETRLEQLEQEALAGLPCAQDATPKASHFSLHDGRRHFARAEKGHAGAAVQLVESADEAVETRLEQLEQEALAGLPCAQDATPKASHFSLHDGRRHFARAEKGHAGAAVQLVESADEAVETRLEQLEQEALAGLPCAQDATPKASHFSLHDGRRHFARAEKGHAGAAVQLVESADEAVETRLEQLEQEALAGLPCAQDTTPKADMWANRLTMSPASLEPQESRNPESSVRPEAAQRESIADLGENEILEDPLWSSIAAPVVQTAQDSVSNTLEEPQHLTEIHLDGSSGNSEDGTSAKLVELPMEAESPQTSMANSESLQTDICSGWTNLSMEQSSGISAPAQSVSLLDQTIPDEELSAKPADSTASFQLLLASVAEGDDDLPVEVPAAFEPQLVPSTKKRKTKSMPKEPERVNCQLCQASVHRSYRKDHIATKHFDGEACFQCKRCSFTYHHWVDVIGLKEHLTRKHHLKLAPSAETRAAFHDQRPKLEKLMKERLLLCFADVNFNLQRQSIAVKISAAPSQAPTDVKTEAVLGEQSCRLCAKPVSDSETRNHVLMEHIREAGFACKHCHLKVPYWHPEFKQMNRHTTTKHPKAGPWQEEFHDLRSPHYPALKTLLKECFGVTAREERKEVYRLRKKEPPKLSIRDALRADRLAMQHSAGVQDKPEYKPGKDPKRKRTVASKSAASLSTDQENGRGLSEDDKNKSVASLFASQAEALEGEEEEESEDDGGGERREYGVCQLCLESVHCVEMEAHVWRVHSGFPGLPFRCRVCRALFFSENLLVILAEDVAGRDYESLTRREKIALVYVKQRQADKPATSAEISAIRRAEQPWFPCGGCGLLVAHSDIRRHVALDHLHLPVLRCRRCPHVFPGIRTQLVLVEMKQHFEAAHEEILSLAELKLQHERATYKMTTTGPPRLTRARKKAKTEEFVVSWERRMLTSSEMHCAQMAAETTRLFGPAALAGLPRPTSEVALGALRPLPPNPSLAAWNTT